MNWAKALAEILKFYLKTIRFLGYLLSRRLNGLAMCSSAAQPQTKQKTCFFAQGRANSELRQPASKRRQFDEVNDNKVFRPQFDNRRE